MKFSVIGTLKIFFEKLMYFIFLMMIGLMPYMLLGGIFVKDFNGFNVMAYFFFGIPMLLVVTLIATGRELWGKSPNTRP